MALSAFAESLIFPLLDFFKSVTDRISVMHPAVVAVLDIGAGICRAVRPGGIGIAQVNLRKELLRGYLFELRLRTDNLNRRYLRLRQDSFIACRDIYKRDVIGTYRVLFEVTPLISTVTFSFVSPLIILTPFRWSNLSLSHFARAEHIEIDIGHRQLG